MEKVKNYIYKNKDLFILKENQSNKLISDAENKLGFKFDNNYFNYLKEFGFISFESLETMGLGPKALI